MSQYRLLHARERIQVGDEGLQYDCETWKPIFGWEAGMEYNPVIMVPLRRALPAPPASEGDAT